MRYLAQRLVEETYLSAGYGENIFYANFDTGIGANVGIAIGDGAVGYNDAINVGSGEGPGYGHVLESAVGITSYFISGEIGGGIRYPSFNVFANERLILRLFAMQRYASSTMRITVKDQAGAIMATKDISGVDFTIMKSYELEFSTSFDTTSAYIEITNQTNVGLTKNVFFLDEIRVFEECRYYKTFN